MDVAHHAACLSPFIPLEPEQDRGLVGKILIKRADTYIRPFRHARRRKTRGTLRCQNINCRFQNYGDKPGGVYLADPAP